MMDDSFEKMLRAVQKPGRYIGGEVGAVRKDRRSVALRFAFCFPDVYEIAMSHLGMKILYSILNKRPDIWCERAFAPWFDMGAEMKKAGYPLFALESRDPLTAFDILGFTLLYEMSYTNVLYMLDLAGIPLRSKDRGEGYPLVIGGGPSACNPEPMADFFDFFLLGDGEEIAVEVCRIVAKAKRQKLRKAELLDAVAAVPGVYRPSLYAVSYGDDGRIAGFSAKNGAPRQVKKRVIQNFNDVEFVEQFPVPAIEVVHDRAAVEVLRGCVRGCRFCQAGFIYRPFRTKSVKTLNAQAMERCRDTGYDEVSLLSLSTSDYPRLEPLLDELLCWTKAENVSLSLPSLRIDNFSEQLIEKTSSVRKSGLTFAPEAGTQRLRDVINKNVTEADVINSCKIAFLRGYTSVKLYFMIGLPGETDGDIAGIIRLAEKVVDAFYAVGGGKKRPVSVTVSASCFVPKPFTPFQFAAQDSIEELGRKQRLLVSEVKNRRISVQYHDASTSFVEAVLARGDRRLSDVVEEVYRSGGIFDSWGEGFSLERWMAAFEKTGIDPRFYANRERQFDEIGPWEMLDYGISKSFLIGEYKKASAVAITPDCRVGCAGCGIEKFLGRRCGAGLEAAVQ